MNDSHGQPSPAVEAAHVLSGTLKRLIRRSGAASGAWINLGSSAIAEMAAGAGFDWLLFDLEHGTSEYDDLLHQLQAIAAFPVAGIVRVPGVAASTFKRILDLGAHGLMIPCVDDADMAAQVVRFARVPPAGVRGVAQTTRASGYGRDYEEYRRTANDSIVLMAQIESQRGVDNVEAIAAVDGIDVLFVGPTDLSVDIGHGPDLAAGPFRDALTKVVAAARQHGKAAGILARNAEQAEAYLALGFSVISLGSDRGLIASGMQANAQVMRNLASATTMGGDEE